MTLGESRNSLGQEIGSQMVDGCKVVAPEWRQSGVKVVEDASEGQAGRRI